MNSTGSGSQTSSQRRDWLGGICSGVHIGFQRDGVAMEKGVRHTAPLPTFWQHEGEFAAAPQLGLHPNPAPVGLYDALDAGMPPVRCLQDKLQSRLRH